MRLLGAALMMAAPIAVGMPAPAAAARFQPRYAAILVDADNGEVLYANAADELRHPASITKLMTLYLTFDALDAGRMRLGDRLTFSAHAVAQRPSKLGIPVGQSISIDDAIRVIAVKSANDVAVALGEKLGGSEDNFARMMTRKARALGMTNTVFTNASGLTDPGNVTSARDIATLSRALLSDHARFYPYFGTRSLTWKGATFFNHNHLLGKAEGMDGLKTGYTVDAGFTLAASAKRGSRRLIAVVLGEPNIPARNRDVTALLDAGFSVLQRRQIGQQTSVAANLPTINHPALRVDNAVEQGSSDDAPARAAPRSRARHVAHETRARSHSAKSHDAKGGAKASSAKAGHGSKAKHVTHAKPNAKHKRG